MVQSRSIVCTVALLGALATAGCQSTELLVQEPLRSGKLVDGDQEGPWLYRYPGGQSMAQGEYRDDKQFGAWTYWHENGNVRWNGVYGDARLDGPTKSYGDDGTLLLAGDFVDGFEQGAWRFYGEDGVLQREGDFHQGLASLRWTSFYPDGVPKAEGFRWKGEPVGLWQYWDAEDTLYALVHPMPDGHAIVFESWPDGTPRREGLLDGRTKVGRWVSYHSNGAVRAEGNFGDGRAEGTWRYFTPDGKLMARGSMSGSEYGGRWNVIEGGEEGTVSSQSLPRMRPGSDGWSTDDTAAGLGAREAIAIWTAELFASATPIAASTETGLPQPSAELAAASGHRPLVPLAPQPWTDYERKNVEFLVQRYTVGIDESNPRPAGGRLYGSKRKKRAPKKADALGAYGELEKAEPWLGKELPSKSFFTGDDRIYDLGDFEGKQPVVLIVLRGFVREVCIYCATQTKAVDLSIEEFRKRGVEVAIVYPGDANRLDTFLESFETEKLLNGDPSVTVLYDPDSALVAGLDIESELAIPSTFILDAKGIIRYAYVGTTIEDRPSVKEMLSALDSMGGKAPVSEPTAASE